MTYLPKQAAWTYAPLHGAGTKQRELQDFGRIDRPVPATVTVWNCTALGNSIVINRRALPQPTLNPNFEYQAKLFLGSDNCRSGNE